jgi:hypothetical protein
MQAHAKQHLHPKHPHMPSHIHRESQLSAHVKASKRNAIQPRQVCTLRGGFLTGLTPSFPQSLFSNSSASSAAWFMLLPTRGLNSTRPLLTRITLPSKKSVRGEATLVMVEANGETIF